MKPPHVKITRKSVMVDPFRGRRAKVSHTIERSGFASGGAVKGIGDVKDLWLRGQGSPWSDAHKGKK